MSANIKKLTCEAKKWISSQFCISDVGDSQYNVPQRNVIKGRCLLLVEQSTDKCVGNAVFADYNIKSEPKQLLKLSNTDKHTTSIPN